MGFVQVINEVLRDVGLLVPERERLSGVFLRIKSELNKALLRHNLCTELVLGGSFGRGTSLRGAHDIDLFVRFKKESDISKFPDIVKEVFPEALELKGSRPYFQVILEGVTCELIPSVILKDALLARNSMDASAFHVSYLNARLNDALRNEVLLLKRFFKACGVYGAESYVGGFSGYVTELLILRFKSFLKFLEFIDSSPGFLFVDLEGFYDSVPTALKVLRVNESLTPVIVVDPVMPSRNAGAGVSVESFSRFVLNARLFLRNPGLSFFSVKERSVDDVRVLAERRGHSFYSFKFEVSLKKDVFFSRLSKELSKVKGVLESVGFSVFDYGFLSDGSVFFEFERDCLPLTKRVVGPVVSIDGVNFDAFISKKAVNGPYVFNGRVCFDVLREHTRVKPLLMRLLREIKF